MDYLLDRLFRETARFLEVCQDQTFTDKISIKDYISLTSIKFDFIENVLKNEKETLFINKDFRKKLSRIYANDYILCNADKKIVGK